MPRVMTPHRSTPSAGRAPAPATLARVVRVQEAGAPAILKRPRPAHGAWRYALMREAARLVGAPTLLPVIGLQ